MIYPKKIFYIHNINKKNLKNEVYLDAGFSMGQVLKKSRLKEMPKNSSLQEKRSDYVGHASFKVSSEKFNSGQFNIDYNYILNKNFNAFLKNEITTSLSNNNNNLSLSYYEENKIGSKHYIETKYQREFKDNLSFAMGLRKNLEEDFTERNFIETNYESDCLKIGLNLSKKFYQDEELQPSNNLTFFIVLKPFGSPVAPDLSKFGDIVGGITRGVQIRRVDGTYQNIVNFKTNGDMNNIMYDLTIQAAKGSQQDGLTARFTMSALGAVVRIGEGEDLQIIIQDDLTSLGSFTMIAEGSEVVN